MIFLDRNISFFLQQLGRRSYPEPSPHRLPLTSRLSGQPCSPTLWSCKHMVTMTIYAYQRLKKGPQPFPTPEKSQVTACLVIARMQGLYKPGTWMRVCIVSIEYDCEYAFVLARASRMLQRRYPAPRTFPWFDRRHPSCPYLVVTHRIHGQSPIPAAKGNGKIRYI